MREGGEVCMSEGGRDACMGEGISSAANTHIQDVVKAIENTPTGAQDRPKTPVTIKDCGTLPLDEPYNLDI